jgi:hypothetical protein
VALLLALAVIVNLVLLRAQVTVDAPPLNDDVLHLLNLRRTVEALTSGQDPTDPWLSQITLGYPLFHYYQHLPYLPPAVLVALSGGALSAEVALRWSGYLLLSFFPLAIYWSGRRMGLERLPALLASVLAPLLATNGLYGLDASSYVWRGYGLYTQLWGMWLLPMALAQGYVTLRSGRGYFLTVLLVSATLLSHLVYGYMLLGSLMLLAALGVWRRHVQEPDRAGPGLRARRLLWVGALVALVCAYFLIPFLRDRAYLNRSVWEQAGKYDSYGLVWVLETLLKGDLFDAGRFPSLTLLAGAGLIFCIWQWRDERHRLLVSLTLLWLLLYFGRPTWGALLSLLPLAGDMQLHRFIGGFQLGSIYLMGLGLAWPWRWARARGAGYFVGAAALTLALLLPAYRERVAWLQQNAAWMNESASALQAERQDLSALLDALHSLPPGRVYAGLPATWGKDVMVGATPLYALLNSAGLDTLGYLYHALSLNADIQVQFDDGLPEQYNLFNVRYVVTPCNYSVPAFYTPIGDYGDLCLYQTPTSGYFDLVGSDMGLVGKRDEFYDAASAWLSSYLVRVKQHPTITFGKALTGYAQTWPLAQAAAAIANTPPLAGPLRGTIISEAVLSNTYEAHVEVARDSFLMLKVTYHPNWRAYVDGVAAETVMLMPSYIGVRLTPGAHSVRLAYEPGSGRPVLLGLGLLTLLLLALADWQRERVARLGARLRASLAHTVERLRAVRLAAWTRRTGPPAPSAPPVLSRRNMLGVYLLFMAIYLLFNAGHFFSTDHVAVYLTTQSLVERHELAIQPINDAVQGPDGKYYASFGIGQSLAEIPLYLLGRWVERISPPALRSYFGGVDLGNWGGTTAIFFVSLLNQLISPLICLLVLLFCLRLGYSRRASWAVTLVLGLCTAVWVYARDSFQHPLETLCLLLCVYQLYVHRERLTPGRALVAGLALAAGVLTRVNLVLVAPLLAAYLVWIASERREPAPIAASRADHGWGAARRHLAQRNWRAAIAPLLTFALPVVLGFLAVLYVNWVKFGGYLTFHPLAQSFGFSTPAWVGFYGNLLSPGRSILLYSPPLLAALFAARSFARAHRIEAYLFFAILAVYLYFYSVYGAWAGGWAWGPRYLLPMVPFGVIPLAGWLDHRAGRIALGIAAGLGLLVQLLGVLVNYSYIHWDWQAMALMPVDAYLYSPAISPIPMHAQALFAGRHIDLWLLQVLAQFGPAVFLLTLGAELLILAGAVVLLGDLGPGRALAELRARLSVRARKP